MKDCGRLLVFEGPDGVGKTTIVQHVDADLRGAGVRVETVAFPGCRAGELGELVYRIHHEPDRLGLVPPTAAAMQLLHVAAHVDAVERLILPALTTGSVVLMDRFWWSAHVYGLVSEVDHDALELILRAELHFWARRKPDAVFLLHRAPTQPERPRADTLALRYKDLASRERANYPVHDVDNNSNMNATLAALWPVIGTILGLPLPQERAGAVTASGGG